MSGRIPRTFIDELLNRTDIVAVIEQFISLKKTGANYQALCPFHNEKSPSFTVSPSKQFYHCFGCRANGNAISFLMEYEHIGFVEAIESLASLAGLDVPYEIQPGDQRPKEEGASLYELMSKINHFYQSELQKNSEAKAYLKSRGLTDDIIKLAGIGYANNSWDLLLNQFNPSAESLKQLLATGMVIQNDSEKLYDRFRHRIMFPISDRRGRIIGFGGRVLDNSTPKYLNSPETTLFHKGSELYGLYEARKRNRQLNRLLVVEGYMDVIGLLQHGISYAVATLGTATTPYHIQQLFRVCPEIVFCFDGDQAGQTAAWRALETLLPIIKENGLAKFMFLPEKDDPDSTVRKIGKMQFEQQINEAESLATFFFRHLISKVNLQNLDGRARLASLAMPYIKNVQADFLREILMAELAKITRIEPEKLKTHLLTPNNEKQPLHKVFQKNKISPIRIAITLLIQHPGLIKYVPEQFQTFDASGISLLQELISVIKGHISVDNSTLTTGSLLEYWRDKPTAEQLALLATQDLLIPESGLKDEFCDTLKTLEQQAKQEVIRQLMAKSAASTITIDEKTLLQKLLREKK